MARLYATLTIIWMGSGTFWEVPHSRNFVESLPHVEECLPSSVICHCLAVDI